MDGSVEAILTCLDTYSSQEVLLDIVTFGIGQVSTSPPPPLPLRQREGEGIGKE